MDMFLSLVYLRKKTRMVPEFIYPMPIPSSLGHVVAMFIGYGVWYPVESSMVSHTCLSTGTTPSSLHRCLRWVFVGDCWVVHFVEMFD